MGKETSIDNDDMEEYASDYFPNIVGDTVTEPSGFEEQNTTDQSDTVIVSSNGEATDKTTDKCSSGLAPPDLESISVADAAIVVDSLTLLSQALSIGDVVFPRSGATACCCKNDRG